MLKGCTWRHYGPWMGIVRGAHSDYNGNIHDTDYLTQIFAAIFCSGTKDNSIKICKGRLQP